MAKKIIISIVAIAVIVGCFFAGKGLYMQYNSKRADHFYELGAQYYNDTKEFEKAKVAFQKSLHYSLRNPPLKLKYLPYKHPQIVVMAKYGLALTYAQLKEYTNAISLLRQLLEEEATRLLGVGGLPSRKEIENNLQSAIRALEKENSQ